MSETGVFEVQAGVTNEQIGAALISYLQEQRGLETEGYCDFGGYYIQARSPQNTAKKMSGLSTAMIATIKMNQQGQVSVEIGAGEWANKVGATIVASGVFPPLMLLPAYGAIQQKRLHKEALAFVKEYCLTAQPSGDAFQSSTYPMHSSEDARSSEFFPPPSDATLVAPAENEDERLICATCGAVNVPGYKFCIDCGEPLNEEVKCAACGFALPPNTKFCANCGKKVAQRNECPNCGEELQDGQRYCHECGADTQA